jgi:hypothetical protein
MAVKIMRQEPGAEPVEEAGYDDTTLFIAISLLCHAADRWCDILPDAESIFVRDQREEDQTITYMRSLRAADNHEVMLLWLVFS